MLNKNLVTELDSAPWLHHPETLTRGRLLLINLKTLEQQLAGNGEEELLAGILRPEERDRFSEFRLRKRRIEWLAGRLAAKQAASRLAAEPDAPGFQDWLIRVDDNGRPFVRRTDRDETALPDISISHSGNRAAALAVDRGRCGLDLQKITKKILKVEKKFCWPEEYDRLAEMSGNPDRTRNLTLLWGAKEAIRKASASSPLPGFMEVIMTRGGRAGDNFRLEFTRPSDPAAEPLIVVGGYHENFALAISLLPDQPLQEI